MDYRSSAAAASAAAAAASAAAAAGLCVPNSSRESSVGAAHSLGSMSGLGAAAHSQLMMGNDSGASAHLAARQLFGLYSASSHLMMSSSDSPSSTGNPIKGSPTGLRMDPTGDKNLGAGASGLKVNLDTAPTTTSMSQEACSTSFAAALRSLAENGPAAVEAYQKGLHPQPVVTASETPGFSSSLMDVRKGFEGAALFGSSALSGSLPGVLAENHGGSLQTHQHHHSQHYPGVFPSVLESSYSSAKPHSMSPKRGSPAGSRPGGAQVKSEVKFSASAATTTIPSSRASSASTPSNSHHHHHHHSSGFQPYRSPSLILGDEASSHPGGLLGKLSSSPSSAAPFGGSAYGLGYPFSMFGTAANLYSPSGPFGVDHQADPLYRAQMERFTAGLAVMAAAAASSGGQSPLGSLVGGLTPYSILGGYAAAAAAAAAAASAASTAPVPSSGILGMEAASPEQTMAQVGPLGPQQQQHFQTAIPHSVTPSPVTSIPQSSDGSTASSSRMTPRLTCVDSPVDRQLGSSDRRVSMDDNSGHEQTSSVSKQLLSLLNIGLNNSRASSSTTSGLDHFVAANTLTTATSPLPATPLSGAPPSYSPSNSHRHLSGILSQPILTKRSTGVTSHLSVPSPTTGASPRASPVTSLSSASRPGSHGSGGSITPKRDGQGIAASSSSLLLSSALLQPSQQQQPASIQLPTKPLDISQIKSSMVHSLLSSQPPPEVTPAPTDHKPSTVSLLRGMRPKKVSKAKANKSPPDVHKANSFVRPFEDSYSSAKIALSKTELNCKVSSDFLGHKDSHGMSGKCQGVTVGGKEAKKRSFPSTGPSVIKKQRRKVNIINNNSISSNKNNNNNYNNKFSADTDYHQGDERPRKRLKKDSQLIAALKTDDILEVTLEQEAGSQDRVPRNILKNFRVEANEMIQQNFSDAKRQSKTVDTKSSSSSLLDADLNQNAFASNSERLRKILLNKPSPAAASSKLITSMPKKQESVDAEVDRGSKFEQQQVSREKLSYLRYFRLVTHRKRNDVEIEKLEKRKVIYLERSPSPSFEEATGSIIASEATNQPPVPTLPLPSVSPMARRQPESAAKSHFMSSLGLCRISDSQKKDKERIFNAIIDDRLARKALSTCLTYCVMLRKMDDPKGQGQQTASTNASNANLAAVHVGSNPKRSPATTLTTTTSTSTTTALHVKYFSERDSVFLPPRSGSASSSGAGRWPSGEPAKRPKSSSCNKSNGGKNAVAQSPDLPGPSSTSSGAANTMKGNGSNVPCLAAAVPLPINLSTLVPVSKHNLENLEPSQPLPPISLQLSVLDKGGPCHSSSSSSSNSSSGSDCNGSSILCQTLYGLYSSDVAVDGHLQPAKASSDRQLLTSDFDHARNGQSRGSGMGVRPGRTPTTAAAAAAATTQPNLVVGNRVSVEFGKVRGGMTVAGGHHHHHHHQYYAPLSTTTFKWPGFEAVAESYRKYSQEMFDESASLQNQLACLQQEVATKRAHLDALSNQLASLARVKGELKGRHHELSERLLRLQSTLVLAQSKVEDSL